MKRLLLMLLGLGLATAALTGCGSAATAARPQATSAGPCWAGTTQQGPAPATPIPTAATVTPADVINGDNTARQFMGAYLSQHLTASQWYDGIRPYLTSSEASAYLGTNPANIPPITLATSPVAGNQVSAGDGFGMTVRIASSIGYWQIQLVRSDQTAPWRVANATPPLGFH